MSNKQDHGNYISATSTHATAASAAVAGVAGLKYYITDVSASSDKAGALVVIKQGTTVIWRSQVQTTAAGFCAYNHTFSTPLEAAVGALVSCEVDGTSVCNANIAGFSLPATS